MLLFLLLMLLALGSLGWALFLRGLEITHWQTTGLSIDRHGIGLAALEVERHSDDGSGMKITAGPARLDWTASRVTLEQVEMTLDQAETPTPSTDDTPFTLDDFPTLPGWLPHHLSVNAFRLNLPCTQGHCLLEGTLSVDRARDTLWPLTLNVELLHDGKRLQGVALIEGSREAPRLTTTLALDGQPRLTLRMALTRTTEGQALSGDLLIPTLNEAPWLLAWLNDWWPLPPLSTEAMPGALHVLGDWQLLLPSDVRALGDLLSATGTVRLDAHLPQPWPVPNVGAVQGDLKLQAALDAGRVLPQVLKADLNLATQQTAWHKQLPKGIRFDNVRFKAATLDNTKPDADALLPLEIDIRTQGEAALTLQGRMAVATQPPWRLRLDNTALSGQLDGIQQPGVNLQRAGIQLRASGTLNTTQADLTFSEFILKAARLDTGSGESSIRLENTTATVPGLRLQSTWGQDTALTYRASGPLELRSERLTQAQLKPQGWRWVGPVEVTEQRLTLNGTLRTDSGLSLPTQLTQIYASGLDLKTEFAPLFMRAGNPLAGTLAAWPDTLEFNDGRLQGSARLKLPVKGAMTLNLQLDGQGLGGLYDRAEFSGLTVRPSLTLTGNRLAVEIPDLMLRELNPGVVLGPLQLSGRYQASLDAPLAGTLNWQQVTLDVLSGQVSLPPGQGNLGNLSLNLPVRIQGIQLASLLEAYPTEGLSGKGTIDGELPLRWTREGIRVEQGYVAAREPGFLRFRSERITALGRTNPGMQLVADALEDFHYAVLRSGVDYHEDGTLNLSLRLEGRNPDLQKGRAFNFSINLEENIPQLLTSLQLTDRVSETLQRRVQERLRRDSSHP
ncbi:dicarboxylate transport [Pseudomonas duriflava]|uniref:Dicarboxylate transport n=1 Tax=Pseudomonas duriflava TaxID=459528 RepID=A0A562QKZ7_9PSED|nr:dicarboxylate transport [Pseudomonas duriflava]